MTEYESLLCAVCKNPDDDTLRLVSADWLEENGEEARAEFIRVQCELALGPQGNQQAALAEREQKLLAANREAWEAPFSPPRRICLSSPLSIFDTTFMTPMRESK